VSAWQAKVAAVVTPISILGGLLGSGLAIYQGRRGYLILVTALVLSPVAGLMLARLLVPEARTCSMVPVAASTWAGFLLSWGLSLFLGRVLYVQRLLKSDAAEGILTLALWSVCVFVGALLGTYWSRPNKAPA